MCDVGALAGICPDAWLTDVMDLAVFRVEIHADAPPGAALPAAIRGHMAEQRRAFYYSKVATDRVDLVESLAGAGLSVVDVAALFRLDARGAPAGTQIAGLTVGAFRPDQAAAVLDIAGSCFRYSRFHLDPRIPDEVAHRVKREWARSCVTGRRGDGLLVAMLDDRPAGFLASLSSEGQGSRIRTIDLVGVASWAQRRGVGRALVQTFVDQGRDACDVLQVGTQAANIYSMQLYERMGFRIWRTQYVLHGHVGT